MELVVYLDATAADWMLDPPSTLAKPAEVRELEDILGSLGLTIRAQHPGVPDSSLRRIFTVDLPESGDAEAVAKRLQDCRAVDGAYVKPAASLP